LMYSYRKYGYLSVWASIVTYSFVFYMLEALFLVLLPLPSTRVTCSLLPSDTEHYTLVILSFFCVILCNIFVVMSLLYTYFILCIRFLVNRRIQCFIRLSLSLLLETL